MDVACGRADGPGRSGPRALFYEDHRPSFGGLFPMAPVCSNCGGTEFVWVNNLRTGTIGRGSLSIRSGGELSLGTRLCRGCGHADLFLKDPAILKTPHAWREGEFVPIPPRPIAPAGAPVSPAPGAPAAPSPPPSPPPMPPASPGTPLPPAAEKPPASPPTPAAPASRAPSGASSPTSDAGSTGPGAKAAGAEATPDVKRPARRRTSKGKTGVPPPTQE